MMNNIVYIKGEIDDTSVATFITDYNKCDLDEPITIYLNSVGGDVAHASVIADVINNKAESTVLIATGEIFSAAFNIFFASKCKRMLLEDCIGMAHFSWATFALDETGKVSSVYEKFVLQEMKKSKAETLQRLQNLGLTPKELAVIKKGQDCYFSRERLTELLVNSNKLNGEKDTIR